MQLIFGTRVITRSVEHAAELAGGHQALGERLGVAASDIAAWTRGTACPDTATFLFVLDLIMDETRKLSSAATALELAKYALAKARKSSKAA